MVASLVFETSLDQLLTSREGYTSLDLLSDVGGLAGSFTVIFSFVISVLNYDYMSNFIASKLYKQRN